MCEAKAMRRIIALALVLAAAAAAQQKTRPNFSGTWELVASKSDFGKIPPPAKLTDVIEHKGPKIGVKSTVVLQGKEYSSEMNYTTDGALNVNFESGGTRIKSRSRWAAGVLVTEAEVDAEKVTAKFTERWQLADGGKTLRNERVLATKQGDVVQKLVYAKK